MNKNQIKDVISILLDLKQINHYECDDCWYSCPKSEEGCCNEGLDKDRCTCGADQTNNKIDEIIRLLST